MKTLSRIVLLFLVTAVTAQAAGRVVARTKRINMLKTAESFVDVSDPELLTELPEVRYPFEFAPEPEKVEEVVTQTTKAPAPPPKVMTNEEVLAQISTKVKPSGVVFRDGKGVLILNKGLLPDGSSIKVNFGDKPYLIRVTDVTADSYTLRLDDASITHLFDAGAGRGVTRD